MASSNYDLKQNVDAATRFLDVLKSPKEVEDSQSQSSSEPSSSDSLSQGASAAAIGILRVLQESGTVPLDEVIARNDASLLEVTEAISRLSKSEAIESREVGGKEALTLTDHGRDLAEAVSQALAS